jgi:hypothetical protein
MTEDKMDLQALLAKSPDADFRRDGSGGSARAVPILGCRSQAVVELDRAAVRAQ